MTVYLCKGDFEHILCGVYDAWMSRKGHKNVRLALEGETFQPSFLEEYVRVSYEERKFRAVFEAINKRLSGEAEDWVYRASLSQDEERADKIYRFLIIAFTLGPTVADQLQVPEVQEIFRLCRFVGNESHLMTEFLRFIQTPLGVLVSRIGPKNDVLPLISPHFADRLPSENWVIWDENRGRASIHQAGQGWFLAELTKEEERQLAGFVKGKAYGREIPPQGNDSESHALMDENYEELWRTFCASIAISQRKNPLCQRTHLPLRYRPYMTEFTTI
ncbi:MAG TPA: TIGR03915 family putative DNA repair protein [Candidatus Enterocloster excrementigallinarum]|uniref:TIGR03915 family putative DNA repair protein n=1 Tax=Candidatus Enterocloster excrementigallinarum TaxID=2838558 RepID=A0A9D2PUP2_9FIRM|nr:TIGR03915 family putative DNA repair protein [Candidatus Enterocloster excrementigallinarum]